jgi:SAM-dependent methyltransferase
MLNFIKTTPFLKNIYKKLNNQYERDLFVISELKKIPDNKILLDAGCGSQRYRQFCAHLIYRSQDFGKYKIDQKKMIGTDYSNDINVYKYGDLDYIGDIWKINEKNETFDVILCTEVLEHIPYPIEAIKEFNRLLKKEGKLILTAPSNCLRHMDPFFFYSGFSDRWYEKVLNDNGFNIEFIEAVGDYYSWLAVEIARTAKTNSFFCKLLLLPAFFYFYNKKKTILSIDSLCMGYHLVAKKVA